MFGYIHKILDHQNMYCIYNKYILILHLSNVECTVVDFSNR